MYMYILLCSCLVEFDETWDEGTWCENTIQKVDLWGCRSKLKYHSSLNMQKFN